MTVNFTSLYGIKHRTVMVSKWTSKWRIKSSKNSNNFLILLKMYSHIYYSLTQVTYFPVGRTELWESHLFPNVFYGTMPKCKLPGRKLHIHSRFSTCHCELKAAPKRGNTRSQGSLRTTVVPKGFFWGKVSHTNFSENWHGTETSWWGAGQAVICYSKEFQYR